MTLDLFEREKRYQTMISISRKMLTDGIISKKDFARVEGYLYEKYQPILRAELT